MKSYFFKNALLSDGWKKNVRIECNGGVFQSVQTDEIKQSQDTVLECVIPAMPNGHSHVFQRSMAGLTEYKTAENDSFWSWRELMYKYANQINAQQLYDVARYTYSEMLQAGYSAVCEFHYVHRGLEDHSDTISLSKSILDAAHDVGIAMTFLPVLYSQSHMNGAELGPLQKRFGMNAEEYISMHKKLNSIKHDGQKLGICFHSLRAVSIQQIKQILTELGSDQPIHIHISEQQAEIDQCLEQFSMRPVEYLYENIKVDENWSLIHATHINQKEIELIANSKAIAGICPLTEANLGDGIFPLPEYQKLNGSFSIGSDSHIAINPFLELQVFEYSQRLNRQKRIIASDKTMPHVGTFLWNNSVFGGAKSCQLNVNGIKVGEQASWIELDDEHPVTFKMKPEEILDSSLFVDNRLIKNIYKQGEKLNEIQSEIVDKYKNTLNQLR